MMINTTRIVFIILICAACTYFERALPFLIFRNGKVPNIISYLGKVLGLTIMATLLIYCLRHISFNDVSSYAPQLIALAVTVGLHLWKGNTMISVFGGTAVCMVLSQLVFY